MFNDRDVKWIIALLEQAKERTSSSEKKEILEQLRQKVDSAFSFSFKINVTEEEIEEALGLVGYLDEISFEYSQTSDMEDFAHYEKMKKDMVGFLERLISIKEKLVDDSNNMKDYLKNELLPKLELSYLEGEKKTSMVKASKLALLDEEYLFEKERYKSLNAIASLVKSKCSSFSQTLQALIQTCSTSKKMQYGQSN